jgi:hypothetical protein
MASAQMIIAHLTLASNRAVGVAIAWHVAIAVGIVALILGVRPSRRAAGVMLAAPIVSAAAVALGLGNPFNGTLLAALALALVWLALRLGPEPVASGPAPARTAGVLLVAFGCLYPHFLQNGTPLDYLYAAPTGVVPCPTLSLVIGFALLADGLGSRAWSVTLAVAGLFYGLVGVARLRVYLDIPLIGGAAALLILAIAQRGHAPVLPHRPRWATRRPHASTP